MKGCACCRKQNVKHVTLSEEKIQQMLDWGEQWEHMPFTEGETIFLAEDGGVIGGIEPIVTDDEMYDRRK